MSETTAVSGYFRSVGAADWSAARFVLHDDWMDLVPAAPSAADQVPVDRIGLAEITGVDQVGAQDGALGTIEVRRRSGRAFEAAVPPAFTDLVCAELQRVHSTAQSTDPMPTPVATAAVAAPPTAAVPLLEPPVTAPVASAAVVPVPDDATDRLRSRKRLATRVFATLAVAGLLGASVGFFVQSRSQRDRAERAESTLAQTQAQLDETTANLERTENEAATTQTELDAANAANGDLTTRVSELGNEKAQVQDERNAAQELSRLGADAAAQMTSCADLLVDIISYVLNESYLIASSALDRATPVCQSASTAVGAFQAAAG